jgi:IS4 transposase
LVSILFWLDHTRQELATKGPKSLVMPRALRRYIELTGGELKLREKAIKDDALFDGKWVLRTYTELPSEEVALAYKSLWQIERTFRELKSGLEINLFLKPIPSQPSPEETKM